MILKPVLMMLEKTCATQTGSSPPIKRKIWTVKTNQSHLRSGTVFLTATYACAHRRVKSRGSLSVKTRSRTIILLAIRLVGRGGGDVPHADPNPFERNI